MKMKFSVVFFCSGVFIVNFEHIFHLFLEFLLLTLSIYLFTGNGIVPEVLSNGVHFLVKLLPAYLTKRATLLKRTPLQVKILK